ncbi:conserved hypothetical protein [Trichinella spiralis]|uniref:hypothetical protein n=1 Tax=Trichinella spiralis TaxID=6334 RepID=UPI0001EFE5AC|nr:conserved hypothetical protein [Trichinella spiralis]
MIIFILRITLIICAGGWVPAQMADSGMLLKRKLCSVVENGRVLDVRAVTSDIPAKDFKIPQHQAIDRRVQRTIENFKRKSSEEQNCPKSTRTEFLNLCQSQFGAIRRMYHELREKDAVSQNVEDPNMRAELEREFEEQSASTKRHTIGVMRLIGKLFVWKMITLTIHCEAFMNRVLYVVTRYCFTWWTCGHAAHASSASQLKFIILLVPPASQPQSSQPYAPTCS